MRIMGVIAVLALLAGCADNATVDGTDDQDGTDTGTGGPGQDGTGDTASENVTATLRADVLNGTAPLQVNLTLNGTGDAWSLAINGTEVANGTQLPANYTHDFTHAGNISVQLDVTRENETATAELTIAVVAAGAVDPNAGLPEPVVWTGDTGSLATFCDPAGEGPSAGSDGYHYFTPADLEGWQFQVEPSSLRTSWWTGSDTSESMGSSGTVPPGRDNVGVCPSGDVNVIMGNVERTDYTMTLWHPDYVME